MLGYIYLSKQNVRRQLLNSIMSVPIPPIANYGLFELFFVAATSSVLPIPTEPTIALLLGDNVSSVIILLVLVPASVLGASVGYIKGR